MGLCLGGIQRGIRPGMSATGELIKCRCGTRMIPNAFGAMICENCDQCQPQESFGIERRKTKQDIRYDMHWLRVMNTEYKDNTDKRCAACLEEDHEACSMTAGCPCCDNTITQMNGEEADD